MQELINNIIEKAQGKEHKYLKEIESKEILKQAGILTTDTRLATTREEAIALAEEIGFPVVLKIVSQDIIHKSDIGGVKLGLKSPKTVGEAYDEILEVTKIKSPEAIVEGVSVQRMAESGIEVIIGVSKDEQFGPVIMFGIGGIMVELLKDVSFRIAPITRQDACNMIREIKGSPLLEGYRGATPVNKKALEDILLSVSELVSKTPQIKEMDINPIFAREKDAIAVDARIILE